MAISIEAGKAFGKIRHSFIIMSHNTREIERSSLSDNKHLKRIQIVQIQTIESFQI